MMLIDRDSFWRAGRRGQMEQLACVNMAKSESVM